MTNTPRPSILMAVLFALGLSACASNTTQTVAFPMGRAGALVASDFQVREKQLYAVSLGYEYKAGDEADRARAWKLAGGSVQEGPGQWSEPGASLRLKVSVVQKVGGEDRQVTEKMIVNPRLSSWDSDRLASELTAVALDPGTYRVTVVSLDEAPSFVGARTSLGIGRAYRGK